MAGKKRIDFIFLVLTLALLVTGFLILFSASAPLAKQERGTVHTYLKHQALFGLLPGLGLGFLFFTTKIKVIKKGSLFFLALNLALTAAVFLPIIGMKVGGASRWIRVGSFSFQPSELLKITLPLYFSVWLTRKQRKSFSTLVCFLLILSIPFLILVFQPDLSTLIIVSFVGFLTYFLSDAPFSHVLILAGLGAGAVLLLIQLTPYRFSRLLVFLNPQVDPMGKGYQIKQSLIAIGSGGLFGKGLGLSKQKLGFLPNVISDSVFSAFCEEAGLVGAGLLILLFLTFLLRVITKAGGMKNSFARVLAVTLASSITFQAFLNMGAMTGLLPLTGLPLPFVSYGGSHLLTEVAACGLILKLLKEK